MARPLSPKAPDASERSHPLARSSFQPEQHRAELLAIIREIERLTGPPGPIAPGPFMQILRAHPRNGRGFFKRAEIIAGFRHFARSEPFAVDEKTFLSRVQRRPIRSQSGVTPLTVLTKPFPCPGRCVFCPNDVRMPKSYLSDEPGAQRAAHNLFDPYLQTWNRLAALHEIGHPVEKVELIVLGGTWSFHPESYQIWFVKRLFDALNDFGSGVDERVTAFERATPLEAEPPGSAGSYNRVVGERLRRRFAGRLLAEDEQAGWGELERAQRRNESAGCRSVGLVVETRPDQVSPEEVVRIRRLGCTKVQLGFQSLSDRILEQNRRGHTSEDTRRAMGWLRRAGFKVHAHWMPNLLGASPESDVEDFARIFGDPALCPDELKIYPCSLIESADLMRYYERGEWRPYDHEELLRVVTAALEAVPRYCRVTRVIRDISSDDIVVGNKLTNFRQIAEAALAQRGKRCVDIRAREIRGDRFEASGVELRANEYGVATGSEVFLELVAPGDRLLGFLRLFLPRDPSFVPELASSAIIRELHVYGASLELGLRAAHGAQHRGLGMRLVERAERVTRERGGQRLSVISAIGTRAYYRKLGFVDGELYQHLDLTPASGQSPRSGHSG